MKTVKCKVVMLSTEKASNIGLIGESNTMHILPYDKQNENNIIDALAVNQHLYITSDEEIKIGDYYYCGMQSSEFGIIKCDSKRLEKLCKENKETVSKIIATTDILEVGSSKGYILPKPTEGFIKKFIEKYNKEEGITYILVEYNNCCCASFDSDHTDKRCNNLKLSSQNEITIHSIKQSWTREEVIKLIKNSYNSCAMHHSIVNQELEEWIEENL